jgi:membrane-associated phospholipid phosphatase
MKMHAAIILFLSILATDLHAEYAVHDEAVDWSVIAAAGAGSLALNFSPYLTAQPLIGGQTDKSYRGDTVPMPWIAGGCGAAGLSILLLPNSDGQFNSVTYTHCKGFSAAMAFNSLCTNLAKTTVGRKRPCYDDFSDKHEGRKSFYSGHSSFSFAASTYLSLFIVNNTGDGSALELIPKIILPLALFSASGAVAASRVKDNMHNVSDVAAGAIAGTLTALAAYRWAAGGFGGRGTPQVGLTCSAGRDAAYGMNVTLAF